MGYKINLSETVIVSGNKYDRHLPEEEDIRTYLRLLLERSTPGQENILKQETVHQDFAYDPIPELPPKQINKWDNAIKDIASYNVARSFKDSSVPFDAPGSFQITTHAREQPRWANTPMEEFTAYMDNLVGNVTHFTQQPNSARDVRDLHRKTLEEIGKFVSYTGKLFITKLQAAGYMRLKGERGLAKEVELRRIQFPRSKLIAIVGADIQDYLNSVYGDDVHNEFDSHVVLSKDIESNMSIVIAQEQIGINTKYNWGYKVERIPRRFKVEVFGCHQLGIRVDQYVTDSKFIKDRTLNMRQLDIE